MADDFLTPEQIERLTKPLTQPAAQSRWLAKQGIEHARAPDGSIVVTWWQVNHTAPPPEEPNWSAVPKRATVAQPAPRVNSASVIEASDRFATEEVRAARIAAGPALHGLFRLARSRHWKRMRQMRKRRATPSWADQDAIAAIYLEAARLQQSTGVAHEVDHIIPLSHPSVCGLHVPWNLQAIPRVANRQKSNRLPS